MSSTVYHSERALAACRIGSPAHSLLDGGGAAFSGTARWNSRGRFVIYAAEHYTGALLEKAAQLNSLKIPRTLVYVRIEIPAGASVEELKLDDLPGWDAENRTASQRYGDAWYDEARSLALLVPSGSSGPGAEHPDQPEAPGIRHNPVIGSRRHSMPSKVAGAGRLKSRA